MEYLDQLVYEIEKARRELNIMLASKISDYSSPEVIEKSIHLDHLITEFQQRKAVEYNRNLRQII